MCNWQNLRDMTADSLQEYLDGRIADGMSRGSANGRIEVCRAFGFWLAGKRMNGKRPVYNGSKRITSNPFAGMATYNPRIDRRRHRRALTEDEMNWLLQVARQRPLDDAMTIRRGPNKGKHQAKISEQRRVELELLGHERALIYKTLALTGLRKSELSSIRESQVCLEHDTPYLDLHAADEKNTEGNDIVLRDDLAEDIRDWLTTRAEHEKACEAAAEKPTLAISDHDDSAPVDEPLFNVPSGLLRILNRDLVAAGIAKKDERGRSIDLHAMRHTFGTWLSKGGVAPRTAQAAMRHSDIDLTMQVYTDPKLLDIRDAKRICTKGLPSRSW